jgi:hypothetical protein
VTSSGPDVFDAFVLPDGGTIVCHDSRTPIPTKPSA